MSGERLLLVDDTTGHDPVEHALGALPQLLRAGDLLVLNDAATLPASLAVSLGPDLEYALVEGPAHGGRRRWLVLADALAERALQRYGVAGVTVHGRVKRFAKIAGEMISLEAVELIANRASPQHQHAATLELMSQAGESTVLFTTDPKLDRIALQKAARELGAQDLAVARRVVHVATLPLLGSGKTDYVRLRSLTEVGR